MIGIIVLIVATLIVLGNVWGSAPKVPEEPKQDAEPGTEPTTTPTTKPGTGTDTSTDNSGQGNSGLGNSGQDEGGYQILYSVPAGAKHFVIYKGATEISEDAFAMAEELQTLVIPKGMETIPAGCFMPCTALEEITVESGNPRYSCENGCLIDNSNGRVLWVGPGGSLPEDGSARMIGKGAFYKRTLPTVMALPAGVTVIEEEAFAKCRGLKNLTLPEGVTEIKAGAFRDAPMLENVNFSNGLLSIGENAFYDTELKKVFLPDGVREVAFSAFKYCNSISSFSFSLEGLSFSEEEPHFLNFFGITQNMVLSDPIYSVRHVEIRSGDIPDSFFYRMRNVTDVTFGEGVTRIGADAFVGCQKIKSLYLPDSLIAVGNNAFFDCVGLKEISLPFLGNGIPVFSLVFGTGGYSASETEKDPELVPKNRTVTVRSGNIPAHAFEQTYYVSKVILPDDAEVIGEYAFVDCSKLTDVTLKNGVKTIGKYAFFGCSFSSITLPQTVKSIGAHAFDNSKKLEMVNFGQGLREIGDYAFYRCKMLNHVTLPAGLTYIGNGAFRLCTALQTIALPDSVCAVGQGAFRECENLTAAYLPEGLEIIPDSLFHSCFRLKTVSMPKALKEIGSMAFLRCCTLSSLTLPEGLEYIGKFAFGNWTSSQCIYYEKNMVPTDWHPDWNGECHAAFVLCEDKEEENEE